MARWFGIVALLSGAFIPGHAAAFDEQAVTASRPLYSLQPGQLIDIYVAPPEIEKRGSFGYDAPYINERAYDLRTGVNYRFDEDVEFNVDARRNRRDPSLSLGGNESDATNMKMIVKPWQLRLGLSYRWGK